MIYKLAMLENEQEKKFDHPCGYGWNVAPKGIPIKITGTEFNEQLASYSPSHIAYAQITDMEFIKKVNGLGRTPDRNGLPKVSIITCTLFYWDDFCILVENHYWEKMTDYWKIAPCHHDFEELSVEEARKNGIPHFGNCYHVMRCKKCTKLESYDSSG
jgi:hypothetical protein